MHYFICLYLFYSIYFWFPLRRLPELDASTSMSSSSMSGGAGTVNDGEEVFYESLEEFHVFVLAHVLRRPIIVVADTILIVSLMFIIILLFSCLYSA